MMLWVMIIRIINSTYFSVLICSSLLDFGEPFSSKSFSVIFSIDNLQERERIRKIQRQHKHCVQSKRERLESGSLQKLCSCPVFTKGVS